MKITEDTIENAVRRLRAYDSLQRKNTGEVGWIAFAYSCSAKKAEAIVEKARARMAAALTPDEITRLQAALRSEGSRFDTAVCDIALGNAPTTADLSRWEQDAIARMTPEDARRACVERISVRPDLAKRPNPAA